MSLYHTTAELLVSGTGDLRSRIFGKSDLKAQSAQIYALAIESCKWSLVLKEIIENAELLRLERKVSPILSVLLVHDLLLAKRGIELPATHGLRISVERHKTRLQAEFTKSRVRRKLDSLTAFKEYVEAGLEDDATSAAPYPRWIRINTLKTSLEDQLDTTFSGYERAAKIEDVRQKIHKRLFIDTHIPNLIALSPNTQISKADAYKSGAIIFQDKASCFPAYLLDPLPTDGDIIDTCSAPGNKTTHLAAIMLSRSPDKENSSQVIHAFEKNKTRSMTLERMVGLAGSDTWTKIHSGHDFLMTDPNSPLFKKVGALLLDPSCSGSGIVGRDEEPVLHLPALKQAPVTGGSKRKKKRPIGNVTDEKIKKRKRGDPEDIEFLVGSHGDGEPTILDSEVELKERLLALSKFQLELLLHAFKFPAARKITYSTCSLHAQENEMVIQKALEHPEAKKMGWRILNREKQPRGMRDWPIRGSRDACGVNEELAAACIRTNKNDKHGTMGFFVTALVRDVKLGADAESQLLRDDRGHLVRDLMGVPVRIGSPTALDSDNEIAADDQNQEANNHEEWSGFADDVAYNVQEIESGFLQAPQPKKQVKSKRSKFNNQNTQ